MVNDPIKHVVVLMLENQSFDRMIGLTPGVDGVDPQAPRSNPNSVTGQPVPQNLSTQARMDFDPPHDYDDVVAQIDGPGGPCMGFVDAFLKNHSKGFPFTEWACIYFRGADRPADILGVPRCGRDCARSGGFSGGEWHVRINWEDDGSSGQTRRDDRNPAGERGQYAGVSQLRSGQRCR